LGSFLPRWKLVAFLNVLFFGIALGAVLVVQLLFPPPLFSDANASVLPWPFSNIGPLVFFYIFAFNLVVSAFIVVTVPGVLFFPLSAVALAFRAILWGLLLYPLPPDYFLVVLPTVVLEGEAYVLAATAGTVTGFSWLKPETGYSRREALKKGLKESVQLYIPVSLLLFIAAVVESATLFLVGA
jgi:hypothetical protein